MHLRTMLLKLKHLLLMRMPTLLHPKPPLLQHPPHHASPWWPCAGTTAPA